MFTDIGYIDIARTITGGPTATVTSERIGTALTITTITIETTSTHTVSGAGATATTTNCAIAGANAFDSY